MGIAFRSQPAELGKARQSVKRVGHRQERCRPQLDPFDGIKPEMLVQPGLPYSADAVACLQNGAQPPASSSPNEPQMAAMLARHKFHDRTGFPVTLASKYDCFVTPSHDYSLGNSSPIARYRSGSSLQPSRTLTNRNRCTGASLIFAIALRACDPIALIVPPPLPRKIFFWLSRSR